jgi:type II secretory pathway pseudopilin PulG
MYSKKERCKMGGFTLIELVVSVGIFGLVILIGVGVILTVLNANRKTRASSETIENIGFAVEEMSRSLQNGFLYHCDSTIPGISAPRNCGFDTGLVTASSLAFEDISGNINSDSDQIVYRLRVGTIEKSVQGNAGPFVAVLDPAITVSDLQFHVRGAVFDDQIQSRVMIIIVGTAGQGDEQTSFSIQTTVRQRVGDA